MLSAVVGERTAAISDVLTDLQFAGRITETGNLLPKVLKWLPDRRKIRACN